jgi:hypothetical protein
MESLITRTEYIKDLEVQIDSKLHFHNHVDYIFSQTIRLLGLISQQPFPFPLYRASWWYIAH